MPFIAKHVRLTNSGKIPDLFVTSRVQSPTDLTDAKLGRLYFVIQINSPWNSVSSAGTSIINVVTREYYRQEATIPLQNFERAIAKANQLIDQLGRDGENHVADNFHALVGLAVGDEFHIAYAGEAEAYFLRDGRLTLITEPGIRKNDNKKQAFNNLITGEISAGDVILLGNPGLYGAVTSDQLEVILDDQLDEAALSLARQIKSARVRTANAIIVSFSTLRDAENTALRSHRETVYLDQRVDSTFQLIKYYTLKVLTPIGKGFVWLGGKLAVGGKAVGKQAKMGWDKTLASSKNKLPQKLAVPQLPKLNVKLPEIAKLNLSTAPAEDGVPVNHYGSRKKRRQPNLDRLISLPLKLLVELGRQFRIAFKRSPRMWYIVIALVLLSSIAISIQAHKKSTAEHPVATAATIDQIKSLLNDARQAKVYGNLAKARELYLEALAKGDLAKQNSRLVTEASSLTGTAQKDLYSIAGVTELISSKPLLTLPSTPSVAAIQDGILYYVTSDGKLASIQMTGGNPTVLTQLPDDQAVNELLLDSDGKLLYLQTYTGPIYEYNLTTKKLNKSELAAGTFPISTGLGFYNGILYLVDPAANEIWKYSRTNNQFDEAVAYTKDSKSQLGDTTTLAIDGSLFALHKDGQVTKFSKGKTTDFKVNEVPSPFDRIPASIGFYADENSDIYYLADRGDNKIQPRIIELDKNGKFSHQYFLPKKWQSDIKLVLANPKSHKAWVVVNKDLYEFTLIQ